MINPDSFDDLVAGIETEMSQAAIEKRGTVALMLARVTGAVYTEAIAAGVPHSLAQDMATDYWAQEMYPEASAPAVVEADEVDQ
ncbi:MULTISPECIES: hypothetical protein [unclassified Streptomyces]|uniref:hypothetical protein n=1 Tax=unclassified Streptomyces TaxID=2593676 RepID=UPI00200E94DA|nr:MULTISPECIES: hypothetical protein [unclassified Streptomyces]MCM1967824.1 hypothetical protein [Streptomyces sp. G1]UQI44662.1 hypothetical protein M1P56_10020 [Streptomyces sp. HU2014]